MAVIDVTYNNDGTFKEANGDLVLANADSALMADILIASQGSYKEFPILGANVLQYVNARTNVQVISRNIKVALKADVFKQPIVDLSDFPSTMSINNIELDLVPNEL